MRSVLACILLLAVGLGLSAQELKPPPVQTGIGIRGNFLGSVIPHSPTIKELAKEADPWGFELHYFWQYNREKDWLACKCSPRLGIGYAYTNFGWEDIGSAHSVFFYPEAWFTGTRALSFSLRPSFGLAYMTKPYDAEDNPDNQFYSMPLGIHISLGAGLHYTIKQQWTISAHAALNHVSNGGVKLPNKGINYPVLGVGLDYAFAPASYQRWDDAVKTPPTDRWRMDVYGFYSSKNLLNESSQRFNIWGLGVKGSYKLFGVSALSLALDFTWDESDKYLADFYNADFNHRQGSIAVGHELIFNNVIWGQEIGWYYFNPHGVDNGMFHRHSFSYRITPYLIVGTGTKVHGATADFMDIRIGISPIH